MTSRRVHGILGAITAWRCNVQRSKLTQIVVLFVALCAVGICLVVLSSLVPQAERVLSFLGSAMFGSGLTFFLVKAV